MNTRELSIDIEGKNIKIPIVWTLGGSWIASSSIKKVTTYFWPDRHITSKTIHNELRRGSYKRESKTIKKEDVSDEIKKEVMYRTKEIHALKLREPLIRRFLWDLQQKL